MSAKMTLEEIGAEFRGSLDWESKATYREVAVKRFDRLLEIAQELDAKVKRLEKRIADDNELAKAYRGF